MEGHPSHKCEFCGSMFKSFSNLVTHKKSARYCLNIRNIAGKTNKCEWCDKTFGYAASFTRHSRGCKKSPAYKDKDSIIQELNAKIENLEAELNEIRDKAEVLKKENLELKLSLENGKGQIKVYKERPGTINNTQYVNPKLLNIKCDTIPPLTIENVKKEVDAGKYTYENYIRGEKGLVDFISGMISADDDQRSYVCTDAARNKFHRLIETREWSEDNGANFLNKIFDQLKEPATIYYKKINAMASSPEEQDTGDFLMDKTKRMFVGITSAKSKDRTELFNHIRSEVRKLAAV